MKLCNNCNIEFPTTVIIDGIKRNLKNRKYCLTCSPFNKHTIIKIYNNKNCVVCDNKLDGNKLKFCSNNCKQKNNYYNENFDNYHFKELKGFRRKIELIEIKGGGCKLCGYNKNISALEFHHIDSNVKSFQLDIRHLSNSKWINILNEAEKCELLCANCHRETHYKDNNINDVKKLLEKYEIKL